jgi:hypothetical protein
MENQIKQLIENYKTEISELQTSLLNSTQSYNEGDYESESDYVSDQIRWGYKISTLIRVVEDLTKL